MILTRKRYCLHMYDLLQEQQDGERKPVAYESSSMTSTEQR